MKDTIKNWLNDLRLKPRDISIKEAENISQSLLTQMANGGYEMEIKFKLKFFFDEKGRPFIQAKTFPTMENSSLCVGEYNDLLFVMEDGTKVFEGEEQYVIPAKLDEIPNINGNEEVSLFNTLINLPIMIMNGLYDQVKYEYLKNKFLGSENKKEKNIIREKIRDRAEDNLIRATLGNTGSDRGRPEKTEKELLNEQIEFLLDIFVAFKKWKKTVTRKYKKRKPTQKEIAENYLLYTVKNSEKKLSDSLKLHGLKFKKLWDNFITCGDQKEFLQSSIKKITNK